jgi:O-antigen ligase
MDKDNSKILKIIDASIFVFLIIYLGSLTNSIFVNQIGFYLPLLLLIVRGAITKENMFRKTGLEIALCIMIVVEIASTIFSVNKGQSFHNFTKFLLLLPTVYFFSSSYFSIKRLKLFFMVYMGFALVSCVIYLVLSYDYVIYNQYQILQSGPSPFKYPITASELISFTVIFFFSFLINEKTSRRNKILLFIGFLISSLALLAIYKRTGWFGTAAGILFVLLYSKKWKIVIPFFVAAVILIFFERSISEVHIYNDQGKSIEKTAVLKTAGRAYDITTAPGSVYLSDYEKGLELVEKNNTIKKVMDAPSAIASFSRWKDDFYLAYLNDTRFILYERKEDSSFIPVSRFFSPGFTNCYKQAYGYLYVCDADSGLTVFKNPANIKDSIRFGKITEVSKIFPDSTTLLTYSIKKNELKLYDMINMLPAGKPITYKENDKFDVIAYQKGKIFIENKEGLSILQNSIQTPFERIYLNKELKNIYMTETRGDTLFLVSYNKKIYKALFDGNKLDVISENSIDFVPGKIAVADDKVYLTRLRESRFASTFDKYNQSNLTRLALWSAGFKIFSDNPVLGVGNIDLAGLYRQYKNDYDKEIQGHMHNNFIHILVTLGIIGLLTFLFLLYRILARLHNIYRQTGSVPFISSYTIGTMGGMIAFIVAGLTEWNFGDHEIITMIWFSTGLCIGLFNSYKNEKQS